MKRTIIKLLSVIIICVRFSACSEADINVTSQSEPVSQVSEETTALYANKKIEDAIADNSDIIGWLTVEGCDIDNVVFQAEDNDYYLRRNEAGDYDVWGCYFLDYINKNDGHQLPDKVNIIYGHSLDDVVESEKFSKLKRYKNADFAKNNPTIEFSLLYETIQWQIFSVCDIPVSIDYIDPNPDTEKYQQTLDYMLEHSYVDFGTDATTSDKILVLSTCTANPNMRFIVAAKQINN